MDAQTEQKVREFYRAKAEYETKLAKKRRSIIKDKTLTRSEKRRRLAEVEMKCKGCKRTGPSRFERQPGRLVATCPTGGTCPSSFTVDVPERENIRSEDADLGNLNRQLETSIIRAKLDLLFGYRTQAESLEEFRRLRPRSERVRGQLTAVQTDYWKTVTRATSKPELSVAEGALREAIVQLKEISAEAGADSSRRAARVYADTIRPLVDRIRALKYADSQVLIGGEGSYEELQLDPYTLDQLLVAIPDVRQKYGP